MNNSPVPVLHDAAACKFYTDDGAYLLYSRESDILRIEHVFVPDHLRGQSLAAHLVKQAVAYSDSIGTKVRPICSYAKAFLERSPELQKSIVVPSPPGTPQSDIAGQT